MNYALEVHDLTVAYDSKPVLWNVDFEIPQGKLVGIIGPNGAGKSTLIKAIMGLIEPNGGYVKIYNEAVENVRNKVAYVPQRETVDWDFPANVMDVVLMGRFDKKSWFQRYNKTDKQIAEACLEKVGMQAFANRQISQLSGGQQQRVFLARALARNADFYLLDEPFAGVDASSEQTILNLLLEMSQQGKTLVVVHHDLQTAYRYFDWIVFLNNRLITYGPKDEVFTDKFIEETYGAKLDLMSKVGHELKRQNYPAREKQ